MIVHCILKTAHRVTWPGTYSKISLLFSVTVSFLGDTIVLGKKANDNLFPINFKDLGIYV